MKLNINEEVKKKINLNPKTIEKTLNKKLVAGALATLVAVGSMAVAPQKAEAANFHPSIKTTVFYPERLIEHISYGGTGFTNGTVSASATYLGTRKFAGGTLPSVVLAAVCGYVGSRYELKIEEKMYARDVKKVTKGLFGDRTGFDWQFKRIRTTKVYDNDSNRKVVYNKTSTICDYDNCPPFMISVSGTITDPDIEKMYINAMKKSTK